MPNEGTQQQQGQQGQQNASPDWRNLESSRDQWKSNAESWKSQFLREKARNQGFDPDKGVGKLLLKAFIEESQDVTPDNVDEAFANYVQETGIEPPSQGEGQEQQNQPSAAEQLMEQAQQQSQGLQDLSQPPPSGGKTTQQQIAEAQQAGDFDTAQQLSFQLAAEQFAQSAQGHPMTQAPQQPAG